MTKRCGICYFCVAFYNMSPWSVFQNKDTFFMFSVLALFCQEFGNLLFEGSTFRINFKIQYCDVKRSLQSFKSYKNSKIILSPKTGSYGRFQKWIKFVTKVCKFTFCVVFENMYPWWGFRIKGRVFGLFSFSTFLRRVFKFNF